MERNKEFEAEFRESLRKVNRTHDALTSYVDSNSLHLDLGKLLGYEKELEVANHAFKFAIKKYFGKETDKTGFEWS